MYLYNLSTGYFPWIYKIMSDKAYLKLVYRIKVQRKLNLDEPKRFNEKLQWLKLNYKDPMYTQMVDKYGVRSVVTEKIGEKYLIPLLGVWNNMDDIDFSVFPKQFVLKCTHDSQGVVICKDKDMLNLTMTKKKMKKALKQNFSFLTKEWQYENVRPRIIAEQYMEDSSGGLMDYKVMCFNGDPKLIQVHRGRFSNHTQDYYDVEWKKLNIYQGCPQTDVSMERPEFLDEMLELSKTMAEGIPHVRVDWYYANQQLYFGEMTFFDASGFDDFEPDEWNVVLGEWLRLPKNNT